MLIALRYNLIIKWIDFCFNFGCQIVLLFSLMITKIVFGTTFEVPVVVVLLAKIGIVTTEQLKNARPYVIVGAFVIAAIITPPDVISQTLLAVPLILLYEAGIWCSRFIPHSGGQWLSLQYTTDLRHLYGQTGL